MALIYESSSNRIILARFDDLQFPSHLHQAIEVYYLYEGQTQVTIDGITTCLSPGDLSIAFSGQVHSYEAISPSSKAALLLCPLNLCGEYMTTLQKYQPQYPFIDKGSIHEDIPLIFQRLLALEHPSFNSSAPRQGVANPNTTDRLPLIRGYLQLLLALLLPHLQLIKKEERTEDALSIQCLSYIANHYTEPLNLHQLSKHLGVSPFALSRLFNHQLSTSFTDYLHTLRIDYAKQLLRMTDLDILTISLQCGYETPRTFNRAFAKFCGCQPRAYRASHAI